MWQAQCITLLLLKDTDLIHAVCMQSTYADAAECVCGVSAAHASRPDHDGICSHAKCGGRSDALHADITSSKLNQCDADASPWFWVAASKLSRFVA